MESSDDAIISKDTHGIITSWNTGAQRIFGYTEQEAVGRHIKLLIPPELHGEEDSILATLRKGRRIDHYVTRRMRKDGSFVDISLTISPIKNEYGEMIGASKVARDIGVQLRESGLRNRLSAIVESSDDAIISKDLNGIITSWNKGAERIFGYTEDEMVGSSILRLIPKELHDEETEILSKLRKGERIEHFQTIRLKKNGERVVLSITVSPVRNDRNDIIGASKVARDITEEKQAYDRIKESEAKFTTIFMSSPVGAVVLDQATYQILDANPAFVRLMEVPLEELIGGDVWDDHLVADPDRWQDMKAKLDRDEGLDQQELRLLPRQDAPIDILINAAHVTINEEPRILMHVEDITERKSAMIALKEADKKKDEFIATLAHELRNPLAPLSNALQMLEFAENDPEMIRDARMMMDRQLKHMVRLMDDLMDVSRISRGVVELRLEALDLRDVLSQAVEAVKPFIGQQGHALVLQLEQDPMMISGDATRLVQIFSNLLNNAAKYTESGGTITVKSTVRKDQVVVEVSDTGVGIEPDMVDRVFDMFAQLEPAISRKHSGLGIGLSIVRQLVHMHGGTILASSKGKGKGSTFSVTMPLTA